MIVCRGIAKHFGQVAVVQDLDLEVAEGEFRVLIGAYSSDGRIAAYGLRVLEDDRHVIAPYDAMLLASGPP